MAKNNKQLTLAQEEGFKNNPLLTLPQEKRLYKLYEEKNIGAFDKYKSCENVVVFGESASGRSTVINSLLGHKLKAVPDPIDKGAFVIDLDDPQDKPHLKISHDCHPEQEVLTPIQAGDITIWECPTLCREIDEQVQMKEFPRVMQLLKTLDKVKFIYVAQYTDFRDARGQVFSFAADVVARIFSDIGLIKNSILLVITKEPLLVTKLVTKAPPGSAKQFMAETIRYMNHFHEISPNAKEMLEYFQKSLFIFSNPGKGGEGKGPTMEDIAGLSFCNVTKSIQYPTLSSVNQELAREILAKDDIRIQEEEAKRQLEQAEINIKNNAWFFIKVVDFLHEILSGMSILTKAGQYAGGMLMTFSSFIGINNLFKSYGSSNKKEEVVEEDELLKPMSPEKAKLAKCLVKMLNENKMLNQKLNECIEQYNNCHNEADKKTIVKQFSEWIISETNLQNALLAFEAEVQVNLEENLSDGDSKTQYLPDMVKIKNNFAAALQKYGASNPNISTDTKQKFSAATLDAVSKIITADNTIIELKDNVYIEQALHDATSDETLDKEIHNIVESEGGSGDNLTSYDKNSADEPQEDNTTETNTVDEREGDGYDAGMRLGGEVNNQF